MTQHKIDLHAHTSTHKLWGLHTDDASLDRLERFMDEYNIIFTVLMATYFPLKGTGLSNSKLQKRIADNNRFKMFGSLDVTKNLMPQLVELSMLAYEGTICGIKLYPGYQPFRPSDDQLFHVYELAKQFDLPVMFHGGELHHCCPQSQRDNRVFRCGNDHCVLDNLGDFSRPGHVAIPAKLFPDVKFIVSHLANPYFDELRAVMKMCPNVYTDISGQFISGSEDTPEYKSEIVAEIQKFLDLPRGDYRLMFATDFPIQSYADSIELIESLGIDQRTKDRIYHQNALSVINI